MKYVSFKIFPRGLFEKKKFFYYFFYDFLSKNDFFDFFAYIANNSAKNHPNINFFDAVGKYLPVAKIRDQPQLYSSFCLGDITLCSDHKW